MPRNKKGFTLIELLVVIAVIGLLSTFAVISLDNARKKARDARRKSDITQIGKGLSLYFNKYGKITPEHWDTDTSIGRNGTGGLYPNGTDWAADSDLTVLVTEGFIGKLPIDPVNNATYYYYFEPDGLNQGNPPCTVSSCRYVLRATLETGGNFTIAAAE